ncbi:MAG TPA: hypothetical protein VFK36_15135, partial [Gemmatimonadales bacterium]|nr:hypothetical protein [Gemmatimonadales bacterium]
LRIRMRAQVQVYPQISPIAQIDRERSSFRRHIPGQEQRVHDGNLRNLRNLRIRMRAQMTQLNPPVAQVYPQISQITQFDWE